MSAEMPFKCGCCDHMSSSQKYTVDHFYSDHTASGALQCPFCLKIFMAVANNQQLVSNVQKYYDHLKDHMVNEKSVACSKCSLRFLNKGAMKAHRLYDHNSQTNLQRHLRELVKDSTSINKPKVYTNCFACLQNIQMSFRIADQALYTTRSNCDGDKPEPRDHVSAERVGLSGVWR